MHSTLNPKQSDDPHDVLVVAPDVALVAPTDDELSRLARLAQDSARRPADAQARTEPEFPGGAAVPPVDATFRPAAVNVRGQRSSVGGRAARAVTALLFAACIGGAAIAWQSFGYAAKQIVGKWAPQFVMTSSLQQEEPGLSAQPTPAPVVNAAKPAPPQPAPPAQTAPQGVAPTAAAPSPESAKLLQSMARDLASMGQELDQLKASIEQVKASQQQMSRDMAKSSELKSSEVKPPEQNARPRISAPPPRWATAPAHRRMPSYPPPQAAVYPSLPQASPSQVSPSYVPRQAEPSPATPPPQDHRELSSVPRPPMPVQ